MGLSLGGFCDVGLEAFGLCGFGLVWVAACGSDLGVGVDVGVGLFGDLVALVPGWQVALVVD